MCVSVITPIDEEYAVIECAVTKHKAVVAVLIQVGWEITYDPWFLNPLALRRSDI